MYNHLFNYFNKDPNKQWYFINNMVIDLKIPEPILAKQLIELTNKFISYGTFNRSTGWFKKNYFIKSKEKLDKGRWSVVVLGCLVIFIAPYFYFFSLYLGTLLVFFGSMITMNEVFDRMNYLKDFKL